MIDRQRVFVYTSDVHLPHNLAGKTGEKRKMHMDTANLLKRQGYGYLEIDGPPIKVPPKPVPDCLEVTLYKEKQALELAARAKVTVPNDEPLQPEVVEDVPKLKKRKSKTK